MNAKDNHMRQACRLPRIRRDNSSSSRLSYKYLAFGVGLALGSLLVCGVASAAAGVAAGQTPTGGKVVGGAGSITQHGAETIIKQQSKLLALDWQTFNVGKDASVLFKQPGVSAIALNRILDQNPSQIFGKINSNGQIFLINTHGIIFGASAQLNVGGLVASTLDLTPDDFLKQHFNLDAHGGHAGVVNHGIIAAASGGSVSLIGGSVENSGLIVADYGHINLDGADKAVLDFDGNGLVNVQITGALQQRFDNEKTAVANKGTLKAEGGTVVLQASAAKDLFTNLVNNSGVIDAHGISTDGGVVRLVGSGGNTVSSGGINVSGAKGGNVEVLSDQGVDVSGGINADAIQNGQGGSVTVFGDGSADISGTLSARGGALGGNGGFIETSGKHVHIADGARINTLAPSGQTGTWLIDPQDFTIASGNTGTVTGGVPSGDISGATLDTALGTSNVTIESSEGSNAGSGNINVNDAVSWSTNTLTLTASNDININAAMTVNGGGLALNPATANGTGAGAESAVTGGTVNVMPGAGVVNFTGTGNSLTIAGDAYTIITGLGAEGSTTQTDLQGINGDLTGHYALGADIDAGTTSGWNSGDGFTPLGGSTAFSGAFDGLGHTISNLTINGSQQNTGLFGKLSGSISNIALLGGTIASSANNARVGALVGDNNGGAISNTFATTAVSASDNGANVGGLVGVNSGTIEGAYATGTVSGGGDAGGLVGLNAAAGSIQDAYATGAIAADSTSGNGGGLAGSNAGTITDAYSTGTASGGAAAGGLAGVDASGTVTNGYWNTDTSGLTASPGGGTGMTTTQLRSGLPAGFSSSTWGIVAGSSFPYLLSQFAPGATPVVVSGTLYADAGTTAAGAGITVDGNSGGTGIVSMQTGANGYYYSLLAPGSITNDSLLLYAQDYGSGGTINGATFADDSAAFSGLDILGNTFGIQTTATAWSVVMTSLAGAEGGGATAATALTSLPVGGLTALGVTAAGALGFDNALSWTGDLDVSAAGAITQTAGLTVTGTSAFNAGNNAITLDNTGNNFTGAVSLSNSGANSVALDNGSNALKIGTSSVGTGTLSLSGTGITQTGAITQAAGAGAATFNAGPGAITLTTAGNDFTGAVSLNNSGANNVALDNGTHALKLGTSSVGTGTLSLNGKGISQSGAITQATGADAATFNAGAGAITLSTAGNDFTGAVSLNNSGANNVSLDNGSNALTLGNVNVGSGTLTVNATGISQAAGTSVVQATAAGAAALDAGGGALALGNNTNDFTGAVTATGQGVSVSDQNDLNIGGVADSGNGAVNLTAGGQLTLPGSVINAGAGALTLASNGGSLTTGAALTGGAVSLTGSGGITLNGNVTAGSTLQLTSTNAAITQTSGAILASGTTTVNAGAGAVTLTGAANDFSGAVSLTGGTTQINAQNALSLGTLATGSLSITSTGALKLSGNGSVTGALSAQSPGSITVDGDLTGLTGVAFSGVSPTGTGSLTGTGAVTGIGSTTFNLTGNKTGTAGGITFTNFTSVDAATVTGASGFDDGNTAGNGITFGSATSVTGSGTISNVTGSFADGTGKSAASGITYTGFGMVAGTSSGSVTGVAGSFNDDTGQSSASGLKYTGFGAVTGMGGSVTGVTGSFDLGTKKSSASGLDYSGFNVTALTGSTSSATIAGSGQTYTLDNIAADQGSSGGVSWTGFGNIVDTGGTVALGTGGSLSGSVTATTLDYGSYGSAVTFDLADTSGATTGIGGTWTDVTAVTGNGNSALTGSSTFALSGANAGSAGGVTFTDFTTADAAAITGAAGFNSSTKSSLGMVFANATSVTGTGAITGLGGTAFNLTGATAGNAGGIGYSGFSSADTTAVTGAAGFDDVNKISESMTFANATSVGGSGTIASVGGSFADNTGTSAASGIVYSGFNAVTGTGGSVTGVTGSFDLGTQVSSSSGLDYSGFNVTALTGSGAGATIAGSSQTYNLTGANAGNNGTVNWTSFGNVADSGTGTLVAANQNWVLTGSGQGTVTNLSGSFAGIGNLADTGTGHFAMHSGADGSLSGSLDAGTGGTLDYTGYTTPVNVNLAGTGSTGIAGNLSGISTIVADSNLSVSGTASDSLAISTGAGATTALGPLAVATGLTVNASGAVLQGSGPLTVGGTTSILAGGNAITLTNANNDFGGGVTVEGGDIALADSNDLNIASLTNSGNGDVSLIAGGALFGVGAIDAGAGDITLAANGGALNTAALTGGNIDLTGAGGIILGDNVTAGGALSLTSGSGISQNLGTVITADSLTGSSVGATTLEGNNAIAMLGNFTADGFSLSSGQTLNVASGVTIDGGSSTTLTTNGAGSDLTIDGTLQGTAIQLTSSGAIGEGSGGIVSTTTLTGSSAGDTTLAGSNQIDTLGQFGAENFTLVNAAALTVQGPLVTTGDISLTTTGPGNVLNVGQALTGGMISLDSAGDLSVVQAIQGTSVNLTANGNLAIDAAVNSGGGVTTLVQNGSAGTISQSSAGTITAGTLTGAAQGGVALTGANVIANLGDFTAEGFSLTNAGPLAVAAGSTLDGGDSTALKTTGSGGDLTINGSVAGTLTSLVSSGAINEGSQGTISAGILTGGAAHGAQLKGGNAINNLGNFTANGLALNNGQALTVMAGVTVDGGASTALTVTGATGNLVINGTLKGATTTLKVSGAISEGAQGVLEAGTLTGKSTGGTSLTGNNDVDNLGDFTANGFALTTDPGLTVMDGKTVDGGSSVALTTTGTGNDIGIDGTVKGDLVTLVSSGAITEGANGLIQADGLTGSSIGDTRLTRTAIDALNAFKSKNFSLTNTKALAVGGPVTTTGNAGDISLATTGNGHALTVNQAVKGAAITLASAGDLTVANAVTGSAVNLAAAGNLVIDAAVDSAAGTTTLTQTGNGAISGGANGSISAATLAGTATGTTTLGSAGQFMANHVDTLGDFSSKAGFSLTNDGTLTLASVNGSAYTVDAGKSDFYLKVQNGDLLQNGTTWSYNGTGTWSAPDGHIGLANAPIYVTGANPQFVAAIGLPPAYFYAVDYSGNLLPLTGATSVNVPTSILSSRSQGVNGHADQYIDVGVITAVYRAYGVVPPGLLLPPDQRQCSPDQPPSEMCPDNN